MTVLNERQQLSYIVGQAADARLNVELETEGMTLNIGPQHPATHGTLRIIARLDGEQVVWAEPVAGLHAPRLREADRGSYVPQVTSLINRIDWLGSFANEVPFILAAEQLMEVEAPPRAQYIRTILFELSRIANVSLFLGDLGVQMGAVTPVFMAFRDREYVLNLIEGAPAAGSTPTSTGSVASRDAHCSFRRGGNFCPAVDGNVAQHLLTDRSRTSDRADGKKQCARRRVCGPAS